MFHALYLSKSSLVILFPIKLLYYGVFSKNSGSLARAKGRTGTIPGGPGTGGREIMWLDKAQPNLRK
jgi:hypothetical protein